jgi:hypothetical protein
MKMLKIFLFISSVGLTVKGNATLIDFESLPSGANAYDNYVIGLNEVYTINGVDITFGFDSDLDGEVDTSAVIEQSGNKDLGKDTGFVAMRSQKDVAATGFEAQLGDFFLRQHEPYKPFGKFVISYSANGPITGASGEIWDIDGNNRKNKTEQFLVEAFDDNGPIESILSPLGVDGRLDGKPWQFDFDNLSQLSRIEISFTGSKTKGIGLAFNNFSPTMTLNQANSLAISTPVSEPSALNIILLGISLMLISKVLFMRETSL